MPNHHAANAATAISGSPLCRFELDSAAPWGGVDFRAMDWTPYGIADFPGVSRGVRLRARARLGCPIRRHFSVPVICHLSSV